MSPLLDDPDERIRSTLRHLPVGDDDPSSVLPAVRAGARARRNRRRTGAVVCSVVALGLLAVPVVRGIDDDEPVLTASDRDTRTAVTVEYPPLTPLADEPLPLLPRTTLVDQGNYVHSIESRPGSLVLTETGPPDGESAATTVDPENSAALLVTGGSRDTSDPHRPRFVIGVTRADVARVEWKAPSGTLSAETFEQPALPQLRFFFIEEAATPEDGNEPGPEHVIAYAADGTVLADSQKLSEYESNHPDEVNARTAEVNRRRGLGLNDAEIRRWRMNDGLLVLDVSSCGGDPEISSFTMDDTAIKVSATVLGPLAEGACTSAETAELLISLDYHPPIGDRPVINVTTGEVIPGP